MKTIIFSIFSVLLLTGCTPPIEEIDVAKEEEAIKEVLKKEISHWWAMELEAESDCWVKEDYMTTVHNNGNKHSQNHGYDSIYASGKRFFENVEEQYQYVSNIKHELKDFNIKVFDKVAWAVYYTYENWEFKGEPYDRSSVRVTFLEKVDGDWKMALNAITRLNPCEDEDEDEEGDEDD
jgi:hypothetical protein